MKSISKKRAFKARVDDLIDEAYESGYNDGAKWCSEVSLLAVTGDEGDSGLMFMIGRQDAPTLVDISVSQAARIAEVYADRIKEYKLNK